MKANPSIKNVILFFAFGLLFGIFLSYLWSSLVVRVYKPTTTVVTTKDLEKEATAYEVVYAARIDSLNTTSKKLHVALSSTKSALDNEKARSKDLTVQVYHLLDDRASIRILDTVSSDSLCDSLQRVVPQLLSSIAIKDSLFGSVFDNFEAQLKNRDSTIRIGEEQYGNLQLSFSKGLAIQDGLANENAALTKTITTQRRRSKLATAALFVLSGIAGAFILHR